MRKNRTFLMVLSLFFISTFMLFSSFNLFQISNNYYNYIQFKPLNIDDFNLQSKVYQETGQWIKNPSFSSPINQYWNTSKTGDINDVDLTEGPGWINYNIIGEKGTVNYIYDPPNQTDWVMMRDPDFPLFPNQTDPGINPDNIVTIDSAGAMANHSWDETDGDYIGQDPGVMWRRNESAPVNMSDYKITSASISSVFNVSAASNIDRLNDTSLPTPTGDTWDHVRFFVRISDLNATRVYDIAYYQYDNDTTLSDTYMHTVPEENLKFYLTSIFEQENDFSIYLVINFFCEDNGPGSQDTDRWYYARIKSVNLTFSYEKKINQNTHASWKQTTDTVNGRKFIINEAKLYFEYKIDAEWPENSSPNSEIQIIINNITHSETIKLSKADLSFQDAKSGGFDVTNLIIANKSILLSLEIYLADNFILEDNLTVSIDNVLLYITRTIFESPEALPPIYIPPGPDWAPIIYLLITVIVGLLVVFGAYQGYFKYPPTVRKIRKLKKNIKKRKAKNPISVSKRESIVQTNLQKQLEPFKIEKYSQKPAQESSQLKKQASSSKNKLKSILLMLLFFCILFLAIFSLLTSNISPISTPIFNDEGSGSNPSDFRLQTKDYTEIKQWIKDPFFDFNISQNWTNSKTEDISDIDLTEDIGYVNYVVVGKNMNENYINNPPLASDWTMMRDPDHPTFPNDTTIEPTEIGYCWIDSNGAFANHSWNENAGDQLGQDPGVIWKRNITLSNNISDYTITSAELSTLISASPNTNVEDYNEGSQTGRGDYVYFFIRISDLSGNYTYEVANYINEGDTNLPDTPMNNVTESDLIFYLSSVLENDGFNFTITMGINFWCEDNEAWDVDEWAYTYIKAINLTFSYDKNIDQNTRGSWSQISENLTANEKDFIINEANLSFQYKIDSLWPVNKSPNSEFKIIINDNIYPETIKLTSANTSFEDAKSGGFNVIPLLVKNENISLSLEVNLADNFILTDNLTLSIDNITLYINRTILNVTIIEEKENIPIFNPSATDWTPIIYLLIAVIAVLLISFGAYFGYFRYPPIIRKIRKLKKKIRKRKAKKPIQTSKRELIINSQLYNQLKTVDLEKILKDMPLKEEKSSSFKK